MEPPTTQVVPEAVIIKVERRRRYFDTRSFSRFFIPTILPSEEIEEYHFVRSSTPFPDDSHVTKDEEWSFESASYSTFLEMLNDPPTKQPVRGMKKVPEDFITGHLVPIKKKRRKKKKNKNQKTEQKIETKQDKMSCTLAESLALVAAKEENQKISKFTLKWIEIKRTVRAFFRKYYKKFIRNKCDYECCTAECECREVKSFLNKRIACMDD